MTDWKGFLWPVLNEVLVTWGDMLVVGRRLAESRRQNAHGRVEPRSRGRLVDLDGRLKRGNRSVSARDPWICVYLRIPTRCLMDDGTLVCVVRWDFGGGKMPVLSRLVHASRMVDQGVHWTSRNRRLVRQLHFGLLCRLFLIGFRRSFDFLLGGEDGTC
jgi:hypothetical protein